MRLQLVAWGRFQSWSAGTDRSGSLAKGAIRSVALRSSGMGLGVVVGILFARALGAGAYGIYAYATTWLAFLTVPATLGFEHVLVRYVAAYGETSSWALLKGLLNFAFKRAFMLAGGIAIAAIVIVAALSGLEPDLRTTLWITFPVLPVVVAGQLRQASLRGLQYPGLAQVPESVFYPVLLLTLGIGVPTITGVNLTPQNAALANVGAWIVAMSLGMVFLARRIPQPVRTSTMADRRPEWTAMVPALIFVAGAHHVLSRGHVLILGALRTSLEVGLFTVASRGAEVVLFVFEALSFVGAPLFSAIYASGHSEKLQGFARLVGKSILWTSLPLYAVLFVAAPWFLRLFGEEFAREAWVMRVLATGFFLSSLVGFVIPMLYVTGRQRDVAVLTGVMALTNIVLSLALIPTWGTIGAAVASVVSLLLLNTALAIVLYRRVGVVAFPFWPGIGKTAKVSPERVAAGSE